MRVWFGVFFQLLPFFISCGEVRAALVNASTEACEVRLSPEVVEDLRAAEPDLDAVFRAIRREFPPESHEILIVGRSPALLAAYTQARHLGYVHNIPLTNFKPIATFVGPTGEAHTLNTDVPGAAAFSADQEFELALHFLRFAPWTEGKTLVVMDYSDTGRTIVSAYAYVAALAQLRSPGRRVKVAALVTPERRSAVEEFFDYELWRLGYFAQADRHYIFDLSGVLERWARTSNERHSLDLSEFGPYDPRKPSPAPEPTARRPEYAELLRLFTPRPADLAAPTARDP